METLQTSPLGKTASAACASRLANIKGDWRGFQPLTGGRLADPAPFEPVFASESSLRRYLTIQALQVSSSKTDFFEDGERTGPNDQLHKRALSLGLLHAMRRGLPRELAEKCLKAAGASYAQAMGSLHHVPEFFLEKALVAPALGEAARRIRESVDCILGALNSPPIFHDSLSGAPALVSIRKKFRGLFAGPAFHDFTSFVESKPDVDRGFHLGTASSIKGLCDSGYDASSVKEFSLKEAGGRKTRFISKRILTVGNGEPLGGLERNLLAQERGFTTQEPAGTVFHKGNLYVIYVKIANPKALYAISDDDILKLARMAGFSPANARQFILATRGKMIAMFSSTGKELLEKGVKHPDYTDKNVLFSFRSDGTLAMHIIDFERP